jgi:hypothetical protein
MASNNCWKWKETFFSAPSNLTLTPAVQYISWWLYQNKWFIEAYCQKIYEMKVKKKKGKKRGNWHRENEQSRRTAELLLVILMKRPLWAAADVNKSWERVRWWRQVFFFNNSALAKSLLSAGCWSHFQQLEKLHHSPTADMNKQYSNEVISLSLALFIRVSPFPRQIRLYISGGNI